MMSNHANWQKYLPAVQMALNLRIQECTGSSPFSIAFGRPFNGFEDFSKVKEPEDLEKAIAGHTERQRKLREIVYPALHARTKGHKHIQEKIFKNTHELVAKYNVGDQVWAIDHTRTSKWDPIYTGPYVVTQVHDNGRSYSVRDMTGEELKTRFAVSHLKLGSSDGVHPGRGKEKSENVRTETLMTEETEPPLKKQKKGKLKRKGKGDTDTYRVDYIVNDRVRNGKPEYLVKWHGYTAEENTWESEKNFYDVKVVKDYWAKKAKANKLRNEKAEANNKAS